MKKLIILLSVIVLISCEKEPLPIKGIENQVEYITSHEWQKGDYNHIEFMWFNADTLFYESYQEDKFIYDWHTAYSFEGDVLFWNSKGRDVLIYTLEHFSRDSIVFMRENKTLDVWYKRVVFIDNTLPY